jgi:hypothetical protein
LFSGTKINDQLGLGFLRHLPLNSEHKNGIAANVLRVYEPVVRARQLRKQLT